MADSIIESLFIENADGYAEINPAARNIECIRAIIDNDPGFQGQKSLARMELAYIYFTLKKEAFANFSPDERDITIRRQVGLKDRWEPSKLVLQAIQQLTDPPSVQERLLAKARQNLEDYLILYEEVNQYFREFIKIIDEKEVKKLKPEDIAIRNEAIEKAKTHFKTQTTNIKELKEAFDLVDSLEAQLKEIKKKKSIRREKQISALEEDLDLYKR